MSEAIETPKAGWRMKVAVFALAVSIFTVLWFAIAALGTKFGLWPWQVGLGQMTIGIGPGIAMLALGLSLIAQVIALIKAPRKQAFILALAATLIAAFCMFRLAGLGAQANSLPPLHDIQTDWADPIQFSADLMAAREAQGETNPVLDAPTVPDYAEARWPGTAGRLVSEVQEEAEAKEGSDGTVYPALESIYFSQSPADVAATAEQIMTKRGWAIVSNQASGDTVQIEATATSGWFGFKDDVAVRVRSADGATEVDIRSTSRVGLSDLGANSTRVHALMVELEDRADGRRTP
jgi:fatty-acyl-CoA synthase